MFGFGKKKVAKSTAKKYKYKYQEKDAQKQLGEMKTRKRKTGKKNILSM